MAHKFACPAIKRLIRRKIGFTSAIQVYTDARLVVTTAKHHVNRGINLFVLLGFPKELQGKAHRKNRIPATSLCDGTTGLRSGYTANRTRVHSVHPITADC